VAPRPRRVYLQPMFGYSKMCSYSNVVATTAVFVALRGSSDPAVTQTAKNFRLAHASPAVADRPGLQTGAAEGGGRPGRRGRRESPVQRGPPDPP
jgi:hypothetical protein